MFRFGIRAIGHLQEEWHTQAIHTYVARLSPFARVDIQELAEGHAKSAKPDILKAQKIEAEHLSKNIPADAFIVALDETGKGLDSVSFAKKLEDWGANGKPVVFIIGGSWGLDASIREKAHVTLSLGKMTLPHAIARIVLTEQLYRAMTILKGTEYHK
jgi:23S rRNA (pseudouridine1915-N3)-methyltransferase